MITDVALLPGTTYEMLSADYWLNRIADTDRVLMDENKILQFNHKNITEAGEEMKRYDLLKFGECIEREDLISMIMQMALPEEELYCCEQPLLESVKNDFMDNRNLCGLSQSNIVRYGVCIKRSDIRVFPTYTNVNEAAKDTDTDILQSSAILINEPVLILHESRDQHFFFIRCSFYDGWVAKESIALCSNRNEWINAFIKPMESSDDFIMVTANKICVVTDKGEKEEIIHELSMGTRLEVDRSITDAYDNYVVKVPVRDVDGKVRFKLSKIPVSAGIQPGYVKYTTRNVLRLAFQAIGDPYGWGGSCHTRDCSSLAMELYRCFGFQLPRDSWSFAHLRDCVSYTHFQNTTVKDREDILKQVRPGAIIGWHGHTMLYVGHIKDIYYVINYVGHFSIRRQGMKPKRYQVNLCLINDLNVLRDNGLTWLESLQYVKSIE